MNPLRRLLPRAQEAACSGCGLTLRERKRKPCPRCGDTRRTLSRGMDMGSIAARDDMG